MPIEDPQGDAATSGGSAPTLGDVTDVVEDHQPLIGDALCTGGDCLLLVVEKFPDANTPEVADGIDAALDELAPGLPGLADGHLDLPPGRVHRHVLRQPRARGPDRLRSC